MEPEGSAHQAGTAEISLSSQSELEFITYSSEKSDYLVMASLEAPLYEDQHRAPIDIVAVIDRSGSMDGSKIKLVCQTLQFVITQLGPSDSLGIVIYDNQIETVLQITQMDASGKEMAQSAIKQIVARGNTDLCGALVQGLQCMKAKTTNGEVSALLLFTDGLANHGVTDQAGILNAMKNYETFKPSHQTLAPLNYATPVSLSYHNAPPANNSAVLPSPQVSSNYGTLPLPNSRPVQNAIAPPASNYSALPPSNYLPFAVPQQQTSNIDAKQVVALENLPCTVHTFGFGSDHDANLLKAIADCGRGVYYFVQNFDQIAPAFVDCLGGLLSVVGKEVTLDVEPLNGCEITKVDTSFKVTSNGGKYSINIGDIQSEEHRDILFRMNIPSIPEPTSHFQMADITVKYFNVISSKNVKKSIVSSVSRPSPGNGEPGKVGSVDKQRNRILAATSMEDAKKLADSSRLEEGRKMIREAIAHIEKSVSAEDPFCKSLVNDLKDVLKNMIDRTSYANYGTYALSSYSSAHQQQRSNTTTPTYVTSSRLNQKSNYATFSSDQL